MEHPATTTSPASTEIAYARSLLFVPGNRPERFEKAIRSGTDAVIFDLEDSVPPAAKALAREAISAQWAALCAVGVPLVIRINAEPSPAWDTDLAWLATLQEKFPSPIVVMVPKAEAASTLHRVRSRVTKAILIPLIETAAGYMGVHALAQAPGVVRLAIGHIDFMADTGMQCGEDEAELAPLRFAVTMATRMSGLAPAIDGVTVQTQDTARLTADTLRAQRFGLGGKLCIHPQQIAPVHAAFAPSAEAVAWAQRVIAADAASGGAAVQLEGRMVDAPVVLQARRTLQRSLLG
jgi:citrate lyase subunit beta / citryl-CoA lyase